MTRTTHHVRWRPRESKNSAIPKSLTFNIETFASNQITSSAKISDNLFYYIVAVGQFIRTLTCSFQVTLNTHQMDTDCLVVCEALGKLHICGVIKIPPLRGATSYSAHVAFLWRAMETQANNLPSPRGDVLNVPRANHTRWIHNIITFILHGTVNDTVDSFMYRKPIIKYPTTIEELVLYYT